MVLRKPLNKVKWFAVILLTNGAAQYQLSSCTGGGLKTSTYGLTVMAVIVGCVHPWNQLYFPPLIYSLTPKGSFILLLFIF